MHHTSPADELAEVRLEIQRLRTRESALHALILQDPDHNGAGRWHRVDIAERCDVDIDAKLLPPHIQQDRNFQRESHEKALHTMPGAVLPTRRPGWPIRRRQEPILH